MIVTLGLLLMPFVPAQSASQVAATDAPARITVAPPDETGERLVVTGRVLGPDGKTPVHGASVYVYQTDKTGVYSRPVDDSRNPRLKGYLRTDASGRYEYSTIRPGSYPNTQNPAQGEGLRDRLRRRPAGRRENPGPGRQGRQRVLRSPPHPRRAGCPALHPGCRAEEVTAQQRVRMDSRLRS
jgi:protocatechuate 3,4-dioxygenase beta subunit